MSYQIIHSDCKEAIKELIAKGIQVDSIVTDPPYELGFMGKSWDSTGIAYDKELWELALQVLKPGGHLLAFSGSRTYHRMACAIEDAGFEIRDSIRYMGEQHYPAYVYGQGFPKSLNIKKAAIKQGICCMCEENTVPYTHEDISHNKDLSGLSGGISMPEQISGYTQQELQQEVCEQTNRDCQLSKAANGAKKRHDSSDMCAMPQGDMEAKVMGEESASTNMLKDMQWEDEICSSDKIQQQYEGAPKKGQTNGGFKSCMEGRSNLLQEEGELHGSALCEMSEGVSANGAKGRLYNGAQISNGDEDRAIINTNGSSESYRSQSIKQQYSEFRAVSNKCGSQERGSWKVCGRCCKPILPEGLGTALKPAWEPVVVARRPLEKGLNVAQNVIKHGTGAINIDGCRVETKPRTTHADGNYTTAGNGYHGNFNKGYFGIPEGRFPANLIHDGSEEVEAEFAKYGDRVTKWGKSTKTTFGFGFESKKEYENNCDKYIGDSGSASRFFYCAKASKQDRNGSKHPTVKPISLMKYLCKLVTPPGGLILDPFAGSGTTGQAAIEQDFEVILIEKEAEYVEDIKRRMDKIPLTFWQMDKLNELEVAAE